MRNFIIAILLPFVKRIMGKFAKTTAQGLWDAFWCHISVSIKEAERQWVENGKGEIKKQQVITKVMGILEERLELNWLRRRIMKVFISKVVDSIISTFNKEIGHGWVNHVDQLRVYLSSKLWFVD